MDIESELNTHHSSTLRAIETGRTELAIRRLESYVKFASAYLDAAAKRGITFSPDKAKSVSLMDWRTPTQIIKYVSRGVIAAAKSGNIELIPSAIVIPVRFMKMSIEKNDFLFYTRLLSIYPSVLDLSYSIEPASYKEIVIDRSWRYPHEFADYILPKLIETHDEKIRRQFISEIIWSFGELMKVTMDHNDHSTFGTIGIQMNSLFQHLEIAGLSHEATEKLSPYIQEERLLAWFGLGAWLMRSYVLRNTKREPGHPDPRLVDPSRIKVFFDLVTSNFKNIKDLAHTYDLALTRDFSSHRWESWIMQTLIEGQVHTIDFITWITYFYVVTGLRLSKTGNIVTIDIPQPFRELQFRIDDIRVKVQQIISDRHNWADLIPKFAAEPIVETIDDSLKEYFLSANEAAIKEWTRVRENEIISSPIDPILISTFKEQCLKGWQDNSWLFTVLTNVGNRIDKVAEADSSYRAINSLYPKEPFLSSNDTTYVGFGYDQGSKLGSDVSENLLSIINSAAQDSGNCEMNSITAEITKIIHSIPNENSALAVLVKGDIELENKFRELSNFSRRWTQEKPRFTFNQYIGDIDDIPIFFLFDEHISEILIIDFKKMGNLIFYSPPNDNFNGLLIRVTEIDEAEASRIIERQPNFLLNDDGSPLSKESAIRRLRLKVGIFIGVKTEINIENSDSIRKISILQ